MMRPLALEMLPVVAFLLCLVATSSPSEPCVTQVSVDAFNVTTPFMMFECSRGYCGIDLPCGESSIGSPTPDNISSTSVAMPEFQEILSALWTWSSNVLAEIDRVVRQVVRETDPTIVTNCRLCLLAMGMYDWELRRRWPLHTHRSKNHPTVTDVVSLVCKGLGLVVVVPFLVVLVCVKMLPHVAVAVMAAPAIIITFLADVAAVVMGCIGLHLLAVDLHFALPMCVSLSLVYWCSAVRIWLTMSPFAGCGLVLFAMAMRQSWLLFPVPTDGKGPVLARSLLTNSVTCLILTFDYATFADQLKDGAAVSEIGILEWLQDQLVLTTAQEGLIKTALGDVFKQLGVKKLLSLRVALKGDTSRFTTALAAAVKDVHAGPGTVDEFARRYLLPQGTSSTSHLRTVPTHSFPFFRSQSALFS